MTRIGIIQGRLVPPVNGRIQAFPGDAWEEEFRLAAEAKLHCIEWVYDAGGEPANPLGTASGIAKIRTAADRSKVAVRSVCADYFMEYPVVRTTPAQRRQRLEKLEWLLGQCHELGVSRVVLPFVDQSRMACAEDEESVLGSLERLVPVAERHGIELHLETSLDPDAFRSFLRRTPSPCVKVNYDSGNSASLGYRPEDEFAAYGERIGSVHIKDRRRGGSTVPLGTGDTDFPALFRGLRSLGYAGDLVLQVARGTPGEELVWAQANRAFVSTYWPLGD